MSVKSVYVEDNIGLVHACAKRFINRGIEYDDIVQAGCIGLIKAGRAFDENRGLKFSTYAVPVILGEMRQLFRSGGSIKVSRSLKDLSIKINRETERFLSIYDRNPSIKELSELLNVSVEDVFDALESSQRPVSLTVSSDEGEEEVNIPVEFDDEGISTRISIMDVLDRLCETDKNLIMLRFFEGQTQSKTAKALGVTQVWVSRREKILLKEMRRMLS